MEWVVRVNVAYYKLDEPAVERHKKTRYNAVAKLYMLPAGVEPWKHVTGPAAACILSLLRIQWKPATVDVCRKWVNHSGDEIGIGFLPPVLYQGVASRRY